MTDSAEPDRFCLTCQQPLNTRRVGGRLTYEHTEETWGGTVNHDANPVPMDALTAPVLKCDFCSQPDPVWAYVCADVRTDLRTVTSVVLDAHEYRTRHQAARARRIETAPGLTTSTGERWSACEGCSTLIDNRDLLGLMSRVTDSMPSKLTKGKRLVETRAQLHTLYTGMFATLQPGRAPISTKGLPSSE